MKQPNTKASLDVGACTAQGFPSLSHRTLAHRIRAAVCWWVLYPGRELCLCSAAPALLLRENQQQCVGVSSLTMICAKQTFRSIPPTGYEI